MSLSKKQIFRLLIVSSIICFLIFQGVVIRTNQLYGSQAVISKENVDLIISPAQPDFKLSGIIPAHTIEDNYYYGLGYKSDVDRSVDLVISRFNDDFTSVEDMTYIENLNISDLIKLRGLYLFNNHLWTIGSYEEFYSENKSRIHRIIYEINLDGEVVDKTPLPMIQETPVSGNGTQVSQLLYVNDTKIVWLDTPYSNHSEIIYYDIARREMISTSIYLPYHNNIAHVYDEKIWLYYGEDPYVMEALYLDKNKPIRDMGRGYYALSLTHPDTPFLQTVQLTTLTDQYTQISSTTVNQDNIPQPVLDTRPTDFLVHSQGFIRPVNVRQLNGSSQILYGFEIYQEQPKFFNSFRIFLLTTSVILFIQALFVKYNPFEEKSILSD